MPTDTAPRETVPRPTVVVVGAGVAGLCTAWTLLDCAAPPHVVLLESADALGGKIRAPLPGAVGLEPGPDGFVGAASALSDICARLGLSDEIVAARTAPVDIWSRGRLRRLPAGLVMGLPVHLWPVLRSRLLTLPELLRAAADLVLPRSDSPVDATIAGFVGARMGAAVVDRLVEPLLGGVYAGRTDVLGVDAVLPDIGRRMAGKRSLIAALRRGGVGGARGLVTVRGGLSRLVAALEADLRGRGCDIRVGASVTALRRHDDVWHVDVDSAASVAADAVILAVPAAAAAALLAPHSPHAAAFAAIPHASLAVIGLAYPRRAVPVTRLQHNGILVPRVEAKLVRAVTFVSAKWPHRSDGEKVLLRCSTGAHGDSRFGALDDAALVNAVHRELVEMIGISAPPSASMVQRWSDALPQYRVGHRRLVADLRASLPPRLSLVGAACDGIGLTSCANQGRDAATALVAELAAMAAPLTVTDRHQ